MDYSRLPRPGAGEAHENALRALEREFAVAITLHDLYGRLGDPHGTPLLPGRHLHPHPCCRRGRSRRADWNRRCNEDCFLEAERRAGILGQPFVKKCWKGLVEVVAPVLYRGRHQMSLFAGVFRSVARPPAGLPDWYGPMYRDLPKADRRKLADLAEALRLFGLGLLAEADAAGEGSPKGRLALIRRFIRDHAHEPVSVADLARTLCISPERARHLTRELAGRPFGMLLEEERMTRAQNLLAATERKHADIAKAVGYPSEFYFQRVFKKRFGCTPGKYRRSGGLPPCQGGLSRFGGRRVH